MNLHWYPFKPNDSFFLLSLPFCQAYLYNLTSRCAAWGRAVLFWRHKGLWWEGTVGLLYMLDHEENFAALCGGEQTGWRWGRGGVKSFSPRERWQRLDISTYHHPSLIFHGAHQLFAVCIIPCKIRPPRFPHNTYCFIHMACDNMNIVRAPSLFLTIFNPCTFFCSCRPQNVQFSEALKGVGTFKFLMIYSVL